MSRGHRPSEPRPLLAHQGNFDEVAATRALRCVRHSENLAALLCGSGLAMTGGRSGRSTLRDVPTNGHITMTSMNAKLTFETIAAFTVPDTTAATGG